MLNQGAGFWASGRKRVQHTEPGALVGGTEYGSHECQEPVSSSPNAQVERLLGLQVTWEAGVESCVNRQDRLCVVSRDRGPGQIFGQYKTGSSFLGSGQVTAGAGTVQQPGKDCGSKQAQALESLQFRS